jgi:hypothetical protein
MEVYGDCLSATSTHHAPWYVVPADDKENARLIVSRLVLDALEDLKMATPALLWLGNSTPLAPPDWTESFAADFVYLIWPLLIV